MSNAPSQHYEATKLFFVSDYESYFPHAPQNGYALILGPLPNAKLAIDTVFNMHVYINQIDTYRCPKESYVIEPEFDPVKSIWHIIIYPVDFLDESKATLGWYTHYLVSASNGRLLAAWRS